MELVFYYKSILNTMCADQSYLLVYITANSMNIAKRIITNLPAAPFVSEHWPTYDNELLVLSIL